MEVGFGDESVPALEQIPGIQRLLEKAEERLSAPSLVSPESSKPSERQEEKPEEEMKVYPQSAVTSTPPSLGFYFYPTQHCVSGINFSQEVALVVPSVPSQHGLLFTSIAWKHYQRMENPHFA